MPSFAPSDGVLAQMMANDAIGDDQAVTRMKMLAIEAQRLIEQGDDASHILLALKIMIDKDEQKDFTRRDEERHRRRAARKELRMVLRTRRDELRHMITSCDDAIARSSAPSTSRSPAAGAGGALQLSLIHI